MIILQYIVIVPDDTLSRTSVSCYSNYAPTVYVQLEAQKKYNCQQVLWLYGDEQKVTEVGTMNVFVLWTNEKGGQYRVSHNAPVRYN